MKIAKFLVYAVGVIIFSILTVSVLWAIGFRFENGEVKQTGGVLFQFPDEMRVEHSDETITDKEVLIQGLDPGIRSFGVESILYRDFTVDVEIVATELQVLPVETLIYSNPEQETFQKPELLKSLYMGTDGYVSPLRNGNLGFLRTDMQVREQVPLPEKYRIIDTNRELFLFTVNESVCTLSRIEAGILNQLDQALLIGNNCAKDGSVVDVEVEEGEVEFFDRDEYRIENTPQDQLVEGVDIHSYTIVDRTAVSSGAGVMVDDQFYFFRSNSLLDQFGETVFKASKKIESTERFIDNVLIITEDRVYSYNTVSEASHQVLTKKKDGRFEIGADGTILIEGEDTVEVHRIYEFD
jgi:hypothetical protein